VRGGKLILLAFLLLLLLLLAAQCQPASQPPTQPAERSPSSPPSPTLLLIPPIQPGDGSDLIDRLLERGIIRVGVRVWPGAEFSPPAFRGFSNAVTGGALNGFEVDIAWLVAEGLGLELELVEAYPPVIASGDWRDEWDIAIASLTPFDQSPEIMAFSRPYGYTPMGVLIPAEADNVQTLGDLSNKKVGVLEYSPYQRLLTPEGRSLTVGGQPLVTPIPTDVQPIPLSNLLKAIHELGESGSEQEAQVDAIFGPAPIFQEAIKSGLPVKLAPQAQNVGFQPLAIAVVPQDGLKVDRLLAEINKILERLQQQGTLAEIYLRWYEQDLSHISE
jgi:polar amino acid transport system substrate-binding protein